MDSDWVPDHGGSIKGSTMEMVMDDTERSMSMSIGKVLLKASLDLGLD